MKKIFLSILLCFCVAVALLPEVSLPAAAADTVTAYYNGTGLYRDVACLDDPVGTTDYAFRGTITDIVFLDGVTSIGDYAFQYCSALTNVTIPSDVTSIGDSAFYACTALTDVTIPANITSIGLLAFGGCSALTAIKADASSVSFCTVDGILFSKDQKTLVVFPVGKPGTSYTIPNTVTAIGGGAFGRDTTLTCITIPASVTSIGEKAFYGCSALTGVTIPSSVTSIGSGAFYSCTGLTSVTIPASVISFGDHVFGACSKLTGVDISEGVTSIGSAMFSYCDALTSVTIPSSVTSIGEDAFADCTKLERVTLPANITSIGDYMFVNCFALKDVTIPANVTSIGDYAFCNCGFTGVTIPVNVASIGKYAFSGCDMGDIIVPASVASIGDYAFQNCGALTGALFLSETPPATIGSGVFDSCADGFTIWVPDSSAVSVYQTSNLSGYSISDPQPVYVDDSFVCGSLRYTVTSADPQTAAVTGHTGSTGNMIIPETVLYNGKFLSVTAIGDGAFISCSDLTGVTIPTSITSIGECAFAGCGLVSADIPASVTAIGDCAFDCCTSLAALTVNENNESYCSVDGVLFSKDKTTLVAYPAGKSDTGYAIPNNVTSIGNYAFDYCTALKSVTIPSSIISIGEGVFEDCENLASVTIPSSVTSIGDYAFADCYALTSVTIPASVISIGDYAFDYCTALASVTIPSSVTSIGDYAFEDCTALTDVLLRGSVTSVGANAFDKGSGTLTFAVPEGTVPYYQGLLISSVMGSTTATIINTKLITAIANLPGAKSVKTGTAQSTLNLPASLTVTVGGAQETVNVTWTSFPTYSASATGTYTFTPVLPRGYALDDGVSGAVTVTVTAPVPTGGSSGGATASTVTVPVSGGSGTVSVSASVSGTTATVSATDAQLKTIASGTETAGTVTVDVSALTVDTVVVPSEIISAMDGASGSTGLAVALPSGTVTLDKAALTSVAGKGDLKISVDTIDNSKLTEAQKSALGNQSSTALIVDVNVFVNGTQTSTFGDGRINVSVPYTPKSGENTDSITVWFIKDDGTIEPKNGVYNAATGCVEFTTEHLSQYLIVSFPFADVTEDAWYYGSVAYAYNNGLFAGTGAATFSPETSMTRQMIWMVLARMDGKTPADMDAARAWAIENGISDGTNPTNSITREQMATILYRYAQYKSYDTTQGGMETREFADYDSISEYALPALGWSVNAGLMQGSDNNLMPSGSATRAQVATILQRFCQNVAK